MPACKHPLPSLKTACLVVGVVDVLVGVSILVAGVDFMAPYGVPEQTLASAHYADAIFWIYSHTVVIGLMIAALGVLAEGHPRQVWVARLLLAVHAYYCYLDLRSSDSALGTGLYEGTASLAPALIMIVLTCLFIHPSVCRQTS